MNDYAHMLDHRVRSQELMKQAANVRLGKGKFPSSWLSTFRLVSSTGVFITLVLHLSRRS